MNKKEINEIKKNISKDSSLLTINKVYTLYIDSEKNIVYNALQPSWSIDEETLELIKSNFVKTLKGRLGSTILEFNNFNNSENYEIFTDALFTKFDGGEILNKYVDTIINNNSVLGPYVIFTAHCTYNALSKNHTKDSETDFDEITYNFIITSICSVATEFKGLICVDEPESKVEKELSLTKVVQDPIEGFLYPAFCDRDSDLNTIMYSCKGVKNLDREFIENALGCTYDINAEQQKETFNDIIKDSIGDDLTYNDVCNINDTIVNIIEQRKFETEPVELTKQDIVKIAEEAGLEDETIENIEKVCDNKLEDNQTINANNVAVSKHKIETDSSITITYNNADTDSIQIKEENGRKYIVISTDDVIVDNFII